MVVAGWCGWGKIGIKARHSSAQAWAVLCKRLGETRKNSVLKKFVRKRAALEFDKSTPFYKIFYPIRFIGPRKIYGLSPSSPHAIKGQLTFLGYVNY